MNIILIFALTDLSLVSDISNKPILMVSVVGDNLHSAVRKLNWNTKECNAMMCYSVIVMRVVCLH